MLPLVIFSPSRRPPAPAPPGLGPTHAAAPPPSPSPHRPWPARPPPRSTLRSATRPGRARSPTSCPCLRPRAWGTSRPPWRPSMRGRPRRQARRCVPWRRGGVGVVGGAWWDGARGGRGRERGERAIEWGALFLFCVCFPHVPTPPSQLIYAGRVLKDDALPMMDVLGPMVSVCVRVWAVRVRGGAGVGFFFVLLPPPLSTSLSSTLLLSGRRARPARPAPGHQGSSRAAATPTPAGRRV